MKIRLIFCAEDIDCIIFNILQLFSYIFCDFIFLSVSYRLHFKIQERAPLDLILNFLKFFYSLSQSPAEPEIDDQQSERESDGNISRKMNQLIENQDQTKDHAGD